MLIPIVGHATPDTEEMERSLPKASYSIQTGAYLVKKNASLMVSNLRAKGYEPYIFETTNSSNKKLYVVRIGDYYNLQQASYAATQFKTLENMPAIITRTSSTTPIRYISPAQEKGESGMIISATELAQIDGRTGTIIDADQLAEIDGQTGTLMPTDELAQIDGRSGTIMPVDELAKISAQTGTVMPSNELAKVDGQASTVIPKGELAKVDGQASTVIPKGDLATVDGQTGPTLPKGDLSQIAAQAAGPGFTQDESEPFVLSAGESAADISEGDPFGSMMVNEGPSGGAVDSATARELREQIEILQEKVDELREEADVRKILEITEEEKQEEEEEILSATGRDYTMAKKGMIGFDYGFSYTYNSFDALESQQNINYIEHRHTHRLNNSLSLSYALRDNVSLGVSIPFVYVYDNMGTEDPRETTDLGDVSFSLQWQPIKAGGKLPPGIISLSWTYPTGRSPYEINTEEDMSTGSGIHNVSVGLSFSESLDPVMVFGGLSASHGFEKTDLRGIMRSGYRLEEVVPGQSVGIRIGLGYALSYKVNMNMNLNYSYSFGGEYVYNIGRVPSQDSASASFSLGTGWRLTPKQSMSVALAKGLSNDASDFSISFRVPFNF